MKQVLYHTYGNSDVLKIEEVDRPTLKNRNSVVVKVLYSSLNAIDWKNRKGDFRMVSGILKPRTKQGFDVVGVVEECSSDITDVKPGDKVVGLQGNFEGGAFSEYVVMKANKLVKIPDEIALQQVAGLPMAGITAWLALVKLGNVLPGDHVLINGGSSGVGHLAIQIAKAYGAEVTSISSTKNIAFCKALGADHVISYQKDNFLQQPSKFDIIFDVVFTASYSKTKHLLSTKGVYIGTTPTPKMIQEMLRFKQAKFVAVQPNKEALGDLINLMQTQRLKVKIDRKFNLHHIVEAHKYMELLRTTGKLILKIGDAEPANHD